ncbi:MAG: MBL fold metallo-hydrolase [Spirochaetaceae bacterium]|nr:MBL fold metallo-hydrolase [Spirochaetaceae bacterium]
MKITVLGSGTSHGVPVAGCSCAVCRSEDFRDKRYRASVFIEGEAGEKVLIDTGPELRLQALRANIRRIDALLYTHSHADHLHGLDDVRPWTRDKALPAYGNAETMRDIETRFSYIFKTTQTGGGKPKIALNVVDSPVAIGGILFTPVPVLHGELGIYGWKAVENDASFVYITDASHIPPASFDLIRAADCLILGSLRARPHPTHFSFAEAFAALKKTGAKTAYLTHLCHDHSHREITDYCKRSGLNVNPAFDGLEMAVLP